MTTSTDNPYEKAREALQKYGHGKGAEAMRAGPVCLNSALGLAQYGARRYGTDPVSRLAATVCQEQFPDRLTGKVGLDLENYPSRILWLVNDHEDTTPADADLILHKSAIAWDEAVR